jgi:hypothetical protein
MLEKQYGHAFIVGGKSSGRRFIRLMALIIRKTTNAIIRNSITFWMNWP